MVRPSCSEAGLVAVLFLVFEFYGGWGRIPMFLFCFGRLARFSKLLLFCLPGFFHGTGQAMVLERLTDLWLLVYALLGY